MNVVKEIQRINRRELTSGSGDGGSWHAQYKDTAWIFAGNIPFDLTEGDVVCIFSQFGEIIHIELIRDHKTGKSKGFAFLQYEDQRSTILAVDNLNGAAVLGRTLRVDHSWGPKKQKKKDEEEESDDDRPKMNVAPELMQVGGKESKSKPKPVDDLDAEDPMAAYFRDKNKKENKSKKKDNPSSSSRHHKHKSSKESSSRRDERSRDGSPSPAGDRGDKSPRRRSYRDESPPSRRSFRDDSPPRRLYRDDTPPSRSYRDDSPPKRSYRRSRSPGSRSPPRRRRSRSDSRSPPGRPY